MKSGSLLPLEKNSLLSKIGDQRCNRKCYLFGYCAFGWLVVLRLNVPVNNFSVMSGRSHRFLGS